MTYGGRPAVPLGHIAQSVLLSVAVACGAYSRVIISPLQESMRVALAFTDDQMAFLQGPALAIPLLLFSLPLGLIIDRYCRVRLLFALSVLNVLATVGTAFAQGFLTLFLARCLVGVAGFAMVPVSLSLVSDWVPPEQRGRSTMAVSIGQLAGSSGAFALGGTAISSSSETAQGWRHAMLWLTAPLLVALLIAAAMKEPERSGSRTHAAVPAWSELWRYRDLLWPLLFGMAMLETALGAVLIWTAPMFSRIYGMPADRIGALMAAALLVSGSIGPIIGGIAADLSQRAAGPRRTMFVLSLFALAAVPAAVYASVPGPMLAGVLMIAFLTLISAIVVLAMTLFTVVIPNELRGRCMSISIAINVLFALGCAPLVVSWLMDAAGGSGRIAWALSIACGTATALAALLFVWAARRNGVRGFT